MRILRLTMSGDVTSVYLIAIAIIEGLSCEKPPTLVSPGPICCPLAKDVKKKLGELWLSCTIYVDRSTIGGFARLIEGNCNVSIFLIAQCH